MSKREREKRLLASSEDGDGKSVELFEFLPRDKACLASTEGMPVRITAKPWADGSVKILQLATARPTWEPLYVVEVNSRSELNTHNPRIAWDKFNSCIGLDQVGA